MEVGLPIGYFYGYKTDGIFQNQEVNAHPSQIALGAMLPLEIFVMLMLMVTEFLTQMTELTWGIQYRKRLWDSIYN
jgi:hypothetical protein